MTDIPELTSMWKEKIDGETTKDESQEPFIPAREVIKNPDDVVLIHCDL
jgi:hypothetical protein